MSSDRPSPAPTRPAAIHGMSCQCCGNHVPTHGQSLPRAPVWCENCKTIFTKEQLVAGVSFIQPGWAPIVCQVIASLIERIEALEAGDFQSPVNPVESGAPEDPENPFDDDAPSA